MYPSTRDIPYTGKKKKKGVIYTPIINVKKRKKPGNDGYL